MDLIRYFTLATILLFGLIWIGSVLFLRLKNKWDVFSILFFTIFYVYLAKVVDYTLIQFQSLLLLKHFAPNIILNGQASRENLNLIPLLTLSVQDLKTSLLNILLFIPFGFGLPFITKLRMKNVVAIGALFSISIELLQLLSGVIGNVSFRIADINDVIFNTAGAAIGYGLFVGFGQLFKAFSHNRGYADSSLATYISTRPQLQKKKT